MRYLYKTTLAALILLMLSGAAFGGENPLKPGMGSAWIKDQGADVQKTVDYVLGAVVAVAMIAFIVFTILGWLGYSANSGDMGNPGQKSDSAGKVMKVLYSLVGIVLFINIGLRFFSWW